MFSISPARIIPLFDPGLARDMRARGKRFRPTVPVETPKEGVGKVGMRLQRNAVFLSLVLLSAPAAIRSQTITVTGDWSLSVGSSDLVDGAGSNLASTYESAANEVIAEVAGGSFKRTWKITVRKQELLWHSSLHLSIRRQTHANLFGGLSYFELTDIDQDFCYTDSKKAMGNIRIQFQLSGVSAANLSANDYSVSVMYTLVDT